MPNYVIVDIVVGGYLMAGAWGPTVPEVAMRVRQQEVVEAMPAAIDVDQLSRCIRRLITLEDSLAPMVSCYAHIGPNGPQPTVFASRVRAILRSLNQEEGALFEEAFRRVQTFLGSEVRPSTRGAVVFSRAGPHPFFLGLQFQVPVRERLSVGWTPNIYGLVELKDSYHRYVVLIATEEVARIVEINLGAVTRELWSERPELRERVGRQWSREHYQNHRRSRGDRFLAEKIDLLGKLMVAGGHTHLILAGTPRLIEHIRGQLPRHLRNKLIDTVPSSAGAQVEDVVSATLSSFIQREQQESLDAVQALVRSLQSDGLGAAGTTQTLGALRRGQADVLIVARDYASGPGWSCAQCNWAAAASLRPERCPECHAEELRAADLKEVMVKLAERQVLEVEVVEHSDALMQLGGIGCLLRYATPEPTSTD